MISLGGFLALTYGIDESNDKFICPIKLALKYDAITECYQASRQL